jgi:hypothetical protein
VYTPDNKIECDRGLKYWWRCHLLDLKLLNVHHTRFKHHQIYVRDYLFTQNKSIPIRYQHPIFLSHKKVGVEFYKRCDFFSRILPQFPQVCVRIVYHFNLFLACVCNTKPLKKGLPDITQTIYYTRVFQRGNGQ